MADELEDVVLGPAIALPTPTMSDVELFMDRTTRQVYGCVAYLEAALTDVREGRHDCARSTPALQQLGLGLYGVAAFYTGVVGALYREITEGMDPDDMKARTDLLIGAARIAAAKQLDQLEESVRDVIAERLRREADRP